MAIQHFLTLEDLSPQNLKALIVRAIELKTHPDSCETFPRAMLGLIFEKSSTRTRVAFETAMHHLGGGSIFMTNNDSQLGRGEPIADSARVLSKMLNCLAIRTFQHQNLVEFAANSTIPVINALSDDYHPCQLLADMQTYQEFRGSISGKRVTWIGDGNNMCHSYINAASAFDFELMIATPKGFEPNPELVAKHGKNIHLCSAPLEAARDSDLLATDVWASMGQEEEQRKRVEAFKDFQVTPEIMAAAHADALFMHCLPAHRGEEVSQEVIDADNSVVWEEAGNRMHSQKALLEHLLSS